MSEIKPKKAMAHMIEDITGRYSHISPEDMCNSPRIGLSFEWAAEQLKQEYYAKATSTYSFGEEAVTELKGEITQIKKDINNNTKLLQVNNDLLLELINLLKLQASQAYFWSAPWIASEREAQDDIEQGNVRTFSTSKQIIDFLEDED